MIHFTRDVATQRPRGFQPVLVKKPTPFPYKSHKAVPWKYVVQGPDRRKDASIVHVKDDLSSAKVTNISGMSGMTRSGHIFAAPEQPVRSKDPKGKVRANVGENNKACLTSNDKVPIGRVAEEGNNSNKKGISTKEVFEFLRIIQQS